MNAQKENKPINSEQYKNVKSFRFRFQTKQKGINELMKLLKFI